MQEFEEIEKYLKEKFEEIPVMPFEQKFSELESKLKKKKRKLSGKTKIFSKF